MRTLFYSGFLLIIFAASFYLSFFKALRFRERSRSLPVYYGMTSVLASFGGALVGGGVFWLAEARQGADVMLMAAAFGGIASWYGMTLIFPAQKWVEKSVHCFLGAAAFLAIFITLALIFTLFFESVRFFKSISLWDFLSGIQWDPQTSYGDKSNAGDLGLYGAVPLFTGTLLIVSIALMMAVPMGLLIAIYMREYAHARTRNILKPVIEILAGIPTIVYGFFALVVVTPLLQNLGERLRIDISPQSALGVGIVMGLMIIPYISSLSDDALGSVSKTLRDHSLALGATRAETIKYVVIPAAFPGIISAILLAVSRAIGETMLVVMAAGLMANLTFNPLQSVTTVTVQIVSLLTGDQEFNSPKTLSAFALGMVLFLMTLMLNVLSLRIARKYREKYDI